MNQNMSEETKKILGERAAAMVQDGMVVGLGTGTTAKYFIEALGEKVRHGLTVRGVASSNQTSRLAITNKIPLLSLNKVSTIDFTADGCDQFDQKKQLIKGRGGALLREKILAFLTKQYIVICTEEKKKDFLGGGLLPIEVLPSADQLILRIVQNMGYSSQIRTKDQIPYISDNQNHIIDITMPEKIEDPSQINQQLRSIPGVIETGFFLTSNPTILLGRDNGTIEMIV